jgi:hypothetical protein
LPPTLFLLLLNSSFGTDPPKKNTGAHTTLPAVLRSLTPSPSTSLCHSLPFPPHSLSLFVSSYSGSRLQDETTQSRVFDQRACSQDCRS